MLMWFKRWLYRGDDSANLAKSSQADNSPRPQEFLSAENIPTKVKPSAAFDNGLLDRARQHWQYGQWNCLCSLADHDLENHPDRAKLALLVGAGMAQTGQSETAKHWIQKAKEWGCTNKLVSQVLIAGTQTHLAHAALFSGQDEKATQWLAEAITTAMPKLDGRLVANVRLFEQQQRLPTAQLEHRPPSTEVPVAGAANLKSTIQPKLVAEFNLGEAWAGNTVNTVIFRHHGIFTHQGHQFTSFYVDEKTLRFVCRRLSDDDISHYDLAGEYNLKDAHNSISMGVDREGYLHVCYDHHASKLRYRRSLQPMRIDEWTNDLPMTGEFESKVTYPTFILPRANYPLTLLYRDGTHNKGSARLKYYDERTHTWKDKLTPILSGVDQKPWSSNAYWNHPAIGSDGSLHLSFVWRTGVLGDEKLVNNINMGYAWSPDNGHHWYTIQGQPCSLPITPATSETIWPNSAGSNLINQTSMALNEFNHPHIAFYANDENGIPQYQHLWFDGKAWKNQILSNRTKQFNLQGGGTLSIPISRPEILLDENNNAYIIYRGDLTDDYMACQLLRAPLYRTDRQKKLWPEKLGYAEPMLDRSLWTCQQRLCLLIQKNEQPNHDNEPEDIKTPIQLVEISFKN